MLKNLVAFLLGFNTLVAYAQPFQADKPVICSDVKTVIETMSGPDWREEPFWTGRNDTSRFILMVNTKTNTWSMLQFNDQVACVVGTGDASKLLNTNKIRT
jgi:hypothetical protein